MVGSLGRRGVVGGGPYQCPAQGSSVGAGLRGGPGGAVAAGPGPGRDPFDGIEDRSAVPAEERSVDGTGVGGRGAERRGAVEVDVGEARGELVGPAAEVAARKDGDARLVEERARRARVPVSVWWGSSAARRGSKSTYR